MTSFSSRRSLLTTSVLSTLMLASLVCLAGLLSMLLLGDGQCPAVFLQLASLTLVIIY